MVSRTVTMATATLALVLVLCLSVYIASCDDKNFTNCSDDLDVLAKALYLPKNKQALNKNFYPPRSGSSQFIRVTYTFDGYDCNVTYIWALGGFLLMQPPKIFQYTSLFFSTLNNNLTDLVLQLPKECWQLVNKTSDSKKDCSCAHDDNPLDILTQQLSVYAKYQSPGTVIRDDSLHVQAICDEELKQRYFVNSHTKIFMVFTILIPIFFIVVLLIFIRSKHEEVNRELALKRNHGAFAALITIGVASEFAIVGIDTAALVQVLSKQYEYSQYDVQHTINCLITIITFSFNAAVGLVMLLCLLYLWCTFCYKDANKNCESCVFFPSCCLEDCLPCCLIPLLYCMTGKRQETAWSMSINNADDNRNPEQGDGEQQVRRRRAELVPTRRTAWILLIMLLSPLFSLASHGGYILAAWLTGPSKATETALMLVATLIYASFVFSHCYTASLSLNVNCECGFWSFLVPLCCVWQGLRWFILKCCRQNKCAFEIVEKCDLLNLRDVSKNNEMENLLRGERNKDPNETLNTMSLCIVLGWSTIVFGSIAFTFVAFNEVPFQTLDLATYLVNIFQVLIVVIAALITYKIITFGEPEMFRFIKKVRKAYEDKTKPDKELFDDLEAVGIIAGNALDATINPPRPLHVRVEQ